MGNTQGTNRKFTVTTALSQQLTITKDQILHMRMFCFLQCLGSTVKRSLLNAACEEAGVRNPMDREVIDLLFTMWDLSGDDRVPCMEFMVGISPLACAHKGPRETFMFALEVMDIENLSVVNSMELTTALECMNVTASYLGDTVLELPQIHKVVDSVFDCISICGVGSKPLLHQECVDLLVEHPLMQQLVAQQLSIDSSLTPGEQLPIAPLSPTISVAPAPHWADGWGCQNPANVFFEEDEDRCEVKDEGELKIDSKSEGEVGQTIEARSTDSGILEVPSILTQGLEVTAVEIAVTDILAESSEQQQQQEEQEEPQEGEEEEPQEEEEEANSTTPEHHQKRSQIGIMKRLGAAPKSLLKKLGTSKAYEQVPDEQVTELATSSKSSALSVDPPPPNDTNPTFPTSPTSQLHQRLLAAAIWMEKQRLLPDASATPSVESSAADTSSSAKKSVDEGETNIESEVSSQSSKGTYEFKDLIKLTIPVPASESSNSNGNAISVGESSTMTPPQLNERDSNVAPSVVSSSDSDSDNSESVDLETEKILAKHEKPLISDRAAILAERGYDFVVY